MVLEALTGQSQCTAHSCCEISGSPGSGLLCLRNSRPVRAFREFEIRQAPLKGAVRLGSHAVEKPLVDFIEVFPHANVGHAFLRRFVVTVDQKNGRIRFQAPASAG
jgi:hypothetical protein